MQPALIALEGIALLFTFAWIFVGVTNYLFATRMGKMVTAARKAEKEIGKNLEAGAT